MADNILEAYPDAPLAGRTLQRNDRWGVWFMKLARLLNRHSSFSASVTLSGGTKTVVFERPEVDAAYQVALSSDANETMRWSTKTSTGFVVTSSNGASTAGCDYTITRTR